MMKNFAKSGKREFCTDDAVVCDSNKREMECNVCGLMSMGRMHMWRANLAKHARTQMVIPSNM